MALQADGTAGPTPASFLEQLNGIYLDSLTLAPKYEKIGELSSLIGDMITTTQEVVLEESKVPDQLPLEEQQRSIED